MLRKRLRLVLGVKQFPFISSIFKLKKNCVSGLSPFRATSADWLIADCGDKVERYRARLQEADCLALFVGLKTQILKYNCKFCLGHQPTLMASRQRSRSCPSYKIFAFLVIVVTYKEVTVVIIRQKFDRQINKSLKFRICFQKTFEVRWSIYNFFPWNERIICCYWW